MERYALVQDVLEALAHPVVMVDNRRQVLAANAAAHAVWQGRLVGRNIALSVRHPDVLDALEEVLHGAAARDVEVTMGGAIPTIYQVRVARLSVTARADEPAALVAFQDLTAARQAERMRADFVANVSHELRSPLTSLLGFIETLRGPAHDDPDARARFLEVMTGEAKRMARLIDDLLSLSRVEADEHVPPRGVVDLRGLLHEIAANLDPQAAARDMRIDVDCEGDLPPALGARDELTLVFRNLLDNAIQYGDAGTAITVTVRAVGRVPEIGGPGVAVAVRDRGVGIAAEHIPRLTERFYRVDKGRSRVMGGTGLGLAIVKHIISHHRGQFSVRSTLGEGSDFTVTLPCAQDAGDRHQTVT